MSTTISDNNKRIAKNTLALYLRTFFTMIVGLYTGRVMLNALGVENYGIYAVVAGIVSMSALITNTMSAAISRYITYALGQGDEKQLKSLFSTSINAQILLSLLIVIVFEVAGMWFLNAKANIPEGRMEAANWVLHCGIVTLVINLICMPFNALIIAHERMTVFAYMSIVDVTLKLGICFLVAAYGGDRLILFALLQIGVALIVNPLYGWYCHRHFKEACYSLHTFDKRLLKELSVFSGWNLLNGSSYTFATQGVNMLVNVFFGVVFNASRNIAMQVNSAIQTFVANFTMAFTPQITKNYASGNYSYAILLVNRGTKFTWFLMLIFLVPVFMESEMLLRLWLGKVPDQASLFLRFAMFESLAVTSGTNLFKLIQADGRIKRNTFHAGIIAGLVFPLTWVAYALGAPVWTAYAIFIASFMLLNVIRIFDIKRLIAFSGRQFLHDSLLPCIWVSLCSFILPTIISRCMEQSVLRFFVNSIASVLWTGGCCVFLGLTSGERQFLSGKIVQYIRKRFNK